VVETLGKMLLVASQLGMSRLPGDLVIRRKNVTVYAPLGLMIFLSLLLTIVLNVWRR